MTIGITREEWLSALEAAHAGQADPPDPSWLRLHEIADLWGLHYNTARRHLRVLVMKGLAEQRMRRVMTEDGRLRDVKVWRLAQPAKKR